MKAKPRTLAMVGRPRIKDLKARYHYDGFFLTGNGIMGSHVAMSDCPRARQIAYSLRRRGYFVWYDDCGLGGYWLIKNGDEL